MAPVSWLLRRLDSLVRSLSFNVLVDCGYGGGVGGMLGL